MKKVQLSILFILFVLVLTVNSAMAASGGGEERDQSVKAYYDTHPVERQAYIDKWCFNLEQHWSPDAAKRLCTLIGAYESNPAAVVTQAPLPTITLTPILTSMPTVQPPATPASAVQKTTKFSLFQFLKQLFNRLFGR